MIAGSRGLALLERVNAHSQSKLEGVTVEILAKFSALCSGRVAPGLRRPGANIHMTWALEALMETQAPSFRSGRFGSRLSPHVLYCIILKPTRRIGTRPSRQLVTRSSPGPAALGSTRCGRRSLGSRPPLHSRSITVGRPRRRRAAN